jgi:protein-S-isoprenylcysteine O-methyltransferase Ste14
MNDGMAALAFVAGSVPIVWLSRRSLRRRSAHGFYRWFAFEAILALIVLAAPVWFVRPFAIPQLASWCLLVASIPFAVAGVVLLHRFGRPRPVADDAPEFGFENTSALVTSGLYGYVRHPMYASLLLLAWGVFLKSVTATTLLLVALATASLVLTARAEEAENLARFGPAYRDYMLRTRRFIPFVF